MPYKDLEKQREYQRLRVSNARKEYLKDKSCVSCGSKQQMEIDHVDPSTKISHRIWSWTLSRRIEELKKCQVLCRKCHHKKTAKENSRPLVHGTEVGYQKGCRCRECMDIHNTLKREYRRRRKAAGLKYT